MPTFDFTTFPVLETARLQLRQIVPDDAEAWLAVFNHPEVIHYLIDFKQPTTDLAEVSEIIGWTQDIFAQKTGIRWGITLKPNPTLIGSCGLDQYSPANRRADLGYELHYDYWRRGIMQEAAAAVLRFGFETLNLHRIEANVTLGNEASAGFLRHMGFAQEGTWRDRVYSRGRFHDLWQFSLLEHEFRPISTL